MEKIKTLTHVLFPLFVGLIIGSAIEGNTKLLTWSIILLILDIVIGIAMQYKIDNPKIDGRYGGSATGNYLNPYDTQKRESEGTMKEKSETTASNSRMDKTSDTYRKTSENVNNSSKKASAADCDSIEEYFMAIYKNLEADRGRHATLRQMKTDEAVRFLIELCCVMEHAPLPRALAGLYEMYTNEVNGQCAIVYKFLHSQRSMCENVYIIVLLDKHSEIRFFAVETDYSGYMLCEYVGNRHKNYGFINLGYLWEKLGEITNT